LGHHVLSLSSSHNRRHNYTVARRRPMRVGIDCKNKAVLCYTSVWSRRHWSISWYCTFGLSMTLCWWFKL